jgi:hypothetical protein
MTALGPHPPVSLIPRHEQLPAVNLDAWLLRFFSSPKSPPRGTLHPGAPHEEGRCLGRCHLSFPRHACQRRLHLLAAGRDLREKGRLSGHLQRTIQDGLLQEQWRICRSERPILARKEGKIAFASAPMRRRPHLGREITVNAVTETRRSGGQGNNCSRRRSLTHQARLSALLAPSRRRRLWPAIVRGASHALACRHAAARTIAMSATLC